MSLEPEVRIETRPNGQRGYYAGLKFSFSFDQMSTFFQRLSALFSPRPAAPPAVTPAKVQNFQPRADPATVATDCALWIVKHEARWNGGHLAVYRLPAGDGGGTLEVAGICNRYHPQECGRLVALISAGRHDEALRGAVAYWRKYTDAVADWSTDPAIEFFLRDTCANRGPGGAAAVLQIALNALAQPIKIDASVGPVTRNSLKIARNRYSQQIIIRELRRAREAYERTSYPWKPHARDESSKFWRGLAKRWDECQTEALKYC